VIKAGHDIGLQRFVVLTGIGLAVEVLFPCSWPQRRVPPLDAKANQNVGPAQDYAPAFRLRFFTY